MALEGRVTIWWISNKRGALSNKWLLGLPKHANACFACEYVTKREAQKWCFYVCPSCLGPGSYCIFLRIFAYFGTFVHIWDFLHILAFYWEFWRFKIIFWQNIYIQEFFFVHIYGNLSDYIWRDVPAERGSN